MQEILSGSGRYSNVATTHQARTSVTNSVKIEVLPQPKARVGMINTAVNRVCEQQFHHYAPPGLAISNTRARVAGRWSRPIAEMAQEIRLATSMAAEHGPDLLVYNCTASSMKEGKAGERAILALMHEASDVRSISTSSVVAQALDALNIRSVVMLSPYPNNDDSIRYLEEGGVRTVHDVALNLPSIEFSDVTPQQWHDLAIKHDRDSADAIFLSCAATTQLEAVEAIESTLGKPVINSNQAILWGCVHMLRDKLGDIGQLPRLGQLMRTDPV